MSAHTQSKRMEKKKITGKYHSNRRNFCVSWYFSAWCLLGVSDVMEKPRNTNAHVRFVVVVVRRCSLLLHITRSFSLSFLSPSHLYDDSIVVVYYILRHFYEFVASLPLRRTLPHSFSINMLSSTDSHWLQLILFSTRLSHCVMCVCLRVYVALVHCFNRNVKDEQPLRFYSFRSMQWWNRTKNDNSLKQNWKISCLFFIFIVLFVLSRFVFEIEQFNN